MTRVVAGGPGPSRPDTLKVIVAHAGDVPADRADLYVTVKGASLVTGHAALTRAEEVARLVADLKRLGLDEGAIQLRGVHAEPAGGLLGRSSPASYALQIRCGDLDALADLLGAVADHKDATLEAVAWGYGAEEALRAGWLDDCIRRANAKARAVAAGLGVTLLGVHSFSEIVTDQDAGQAPPPPAADEPAGVRGFAAARSRATRDALGLAVAHTKRVELRVAVEYRISGFVAEAGLEAPGEARGKADGEFRSP